MPFLRFCMFEALQSKTSLRFEKNLEMCLFFDVCWFSKAILRCFDITCLSYDRFCQDKRAKARKRIEEAELMREQERQNQTFAAAQSKSSGSALDEWMEKLKVGLLSQRFYFSKLFLQEVKEDVKKRLNNANATSSGSPNKSRNFFEEVLFFFFSCLFFIPG